MVWPKIPQWVHTWWLFDLEDEFALAKNFAMKVGCELQEQKFAADDGVEIKRIDLCCSSWWMREKSLLIGGGGSMSKIWDCVEV